MMRLPHFEYCSPRTIGEALSRLAEAPSESMLLAGGTDLLPNMKRRQQTPRVVIGLRGIPDLLTIRSGPSLRLGAGITLATLVDDQLVRREHTALWQAARQIATPHLRNMGTLGGNLCLDTRCTYYDQNYEWRKAIDFCLKKDGDVCWVAPGSRECLAVSSTDTAPALWALGATVHLASARGERRIRVSDLYRRDGIDYLTRRPDEILTAVELPRETGWRSTYWKLRRRGSFDFPVLSVAAAVRADPSGLISAARIVLGAVASSPLEAVAAGAFLVGRRLEEETIEEAGRLAAQPAKPMDNTDFDLDLAEARRQAVRRGCAPRAAR